MLIAEGKQLRKQRTINWHEARDKPRGRPPHKHVIEIERWETAPVLPNETA